MRPAHLSLIALLGLVSTDAMALRCGNQLVSEGMTRYEVRKRCGDPDDSQVRYETHYRRTALDESVAVEVEIVRPHAHLNAAFAHQRQRGTEAYGEQ